MRQLFQRIKEIFISPEGHEESPKAEFISDYEREKRNIPEGYSLKDDCLYWHDRKLDLPGTYSGAMVINGIFIYTCDASSSQSNVFGFDLLGNKLWVIDPVPYLVPDPDWGTARAYQGPMWNDFYNAIVVCSLLGMYELDPKTGHIVRQILTANDLR